MNSAQWERMKTHTYKTGDMEILMQMHQLFESIKDGEFQSSTDPAFLAALATLVEDCGGVLLDICPACGKTVTADCNGANCS